MIVECVKNVCGLSIVEKYEEYLEFNLRKFQLEHCDGGDSFAGADDSDDCA